MKGGRQEVNKGFPPARQAVTLTWLNWREPGSFQWEAAN